MPGSTPPTSQLDWFISITAMIVLFWSRATRDLLKSFGWGIGALHRLDAATKLPFPRRPPHSISRSRWSSASNQVFEITGSSSTSTHRWALRLAAAARLALVGPGCLRGSHLAGFYQLAVSAGVA